MEIITASLPLAVRAPGSQPRVSPAIFQPAQKTGAALAAVRSERPTLISADQISVSVAPPPGTSVVASLRRQLFEIGLESVTGAFSRLVTSIFSFSSTAVSSSPIQPVADSQPEFVSFTAASQPAIDQQATIAALADTSLSEPVQQTAPPLTPPEFIEIAPAGHTAVAPATVIHPLSQLAASPVSPLPGGVAAVSEVFRSMPLEQHRQRRLDIFDVEFAARNHAIHPQTLSGSRFDRMV